MGHEQRKRQEELTGALARIVVSILNATGQRTAAVTLGISYPTAEDKVQVHCATMAVSKEAERAHALILAQSLTSEPVPPEAPPANQETPA